MSAASGASASRALRWPIPSQRAESRRLRETRALSIARPALPNRYVTPGLTAQAGFPPPGYFSGRFGDPLLPPDGRRVAFTARHVYGPEDLLVLEGP